MEGLTILEKGLNITLILLSGFIIYRGLYVYYTTKKKIAFLIASSFIFMLLHHITQILKIADATIFLFFALFVMIFAFYRKLMYLGNEKIQFFRLQIPKIILVICAATGVLFFIAMLLHYTTGTELKQIRIISHIIIRLGTMLLGYFVFTLSKSKAYKNLVQSFIIICFSTLLMFPIIFLFALLSSTIYSLAPTINLKFLSILAEIPGIIIALYAYYLSIKSIDEIEGQQEIY